MKLKSIAVIFAVSAIDLGACGNSETKGAAGESTGVKIQKCLGILPRRTVYSKITLRLL